ncbi:MAG: histidine kinase N-terminal domain-containing protein [Candidatus Microthrix sp.]|uniref:histidine kinase n=1 Tax=Candidatus Neomicrothrix subdominans TaxID=2954438 RepID=A0A936NAL8_9ACTN|nr:histidine kinase N-terminal domain-containing protein [Candidatus Microthrix subdominans]
MPEAPGDQARVPSDPVEDHLRRLAVVWGVLSDLSFADLLLYVRAGKGYLVRSQVRPTTGQTIYESDLVGVWASAAERPLVDRAWRTGRIERGDLFVEELEDWVAVQATPVTWRGEVVAVMSSEQAPPPRRQPGELERVYQAIFGRLARMITAGSFPYPPGPEDRVPREPPRVGDGLILLDGDGRVEFASPNATSALNRAGVEGQMRSTHLAEAGLDQLATRLAFRTKRPTSEEVAVGPVVIDLEVLPLLVRAEVTGAVVFLRDVSEIRQLDLLLLSKDATIREIHHRVKNNLQTISSLLRLQGRRISQPEAIRAVQESVQRIQAISVVYELLSREHRDDVDLREIVAAIVRNMDQVTGAHVKIRLAGTAGRAPSDVATPLAIIVNELIQNALDHAFPNLGEEGQAQARGVGDARSKRSRAAHEGGRQRGRRRREHRSEQRRSGAVDRVVARHRGTRRHDRDRSPASGVGWGSGGRRTGHEGRGRRRGAGPGCSEWGRPHPGATGDAPRGG